MSVLKPLNYYANLPYPIETTALSQEQLRCLCVRMLNMPDGLQHHISFGPIPVFPEWIHDNWDALLTDPSGVVRWAAQYLQNAQDAIPQKISGVEHCKTDTRKSHSDDSGVQGCLARGGCA